MMEILKVSTKSNPVSVAGAMAAIIKNDGQVSLLAIGAGAVNQAVKAVAIAKGYLAPQGIDIYCSPGFTDINIGGESKTGIRLAIFQKQL